MWIQESTQQVIKVMMRMSAQHNTLTMNCLMTGWVGWDEIWSKKANHSKYEPNVHNMLNMLKVAIYENR